MYKKEGVQGTNYYVDPEIEKFRYNPYRKANRKYANECYAKGEPTKWPVHLIIETSSLCNLKCDFCNREVMSRPQMNMSMEIFKRVVDQGAEMGAYSLSLYCLGEPLLNPNLRDMIIYAKRMGIPYVDVSTNGTQSLSPLLGTGLNEVIVNNYIGYLGKWVDLFKFDVDGEVGPIIRMQLIDLPQYRERNVNIIADFNADSPYDVIYLKKVEVFSQSLGDKNLPQVEIDKRLKDRKPCGQLYFVLTINSNGDICYCCHDPKGKSVLGNISDITLMDVWKELVPIREAHKMGTYTELCSECVDYSW